MPNKPTHPQRKALMNVVMCQRCGNGHDRVEFRTFELGDARFTHWAYCPATGEPLLIDARQNQQLNAPPQFLVQWVNAGPNASLANDPKFPEGKDVAPLGLNTLRPSCVCDLPYPASSTGVWQVVCSHCDSRGVCDAGGHPSDPKSIRIQCKRHGAPPVDKSPPSQGS